MNLKPGTVHGSHRTTIHNTVAALCTKGLRQTQKDYNSEAETESVLVINN